MRPSQKWRGHDAKKGISSLERANLAFQGKLCAFEDCLVPPEQQCPTCKLWYCQICFPYHFTGYPEHYRKCPCDQDLYKHLRDEEK